MAVWTRARMQDAVCWTTAQFPGYEIEMQDDEAWYRVWSPAGLIGTRPKFADAQSFVASDMALVASATQVKL